MIVYRKIKQLKYTYQNRDDLSNVSHASNKYTAHDSVWIIFLKLAQRV